MKKPFKVIVILTWIVAIAIFGFLGFKVIIDRKLTAIKTVKQVLELRSQQDSSRINNLFTQEYKLKAKRKGSLINTLTYNLEYKKMDHDTVTMFYGAEKNNKKMPILKFVLENHGNFFRYDWKVNDIEELDPYLTETVENILVEKKVKEFKDKSFDVDGLSGSLVSVEKVAAKDNAEVEEDDYYLVKIKFSDTRIVKDKKIMATLQDKNGDCASRSPMGLGEAKDGVVEERLYLYRECKPSNIFMYGLINDNIKLNVE